MREQFARDRQQADAKANAEIDQTKKDARRGGASSKRMRRAGETKIPQEATAREAKVREEAIAQEAAKNEALLAAANRERQESEGALRAQIESAAVQRDAAEQARIELAGQLELVKAGQAAEIETVRREAAAREKNDPRRSGEGRRRCRP